MSNPGNEWEGFIHSHPDAHLLQTCAWGELKSGFGWKPVPIICGSLGAQLLFRRLPLGLTVAYLPRGPVGQPVDGADWRTFWSQVDRVCRAHHAIFLKVEPDRWEDEPSAPALPSDFRPAPRSIQPPRTLVVDLRGSEDEILARMKQKTRYNIRLAEKKRVTVSPSQDVTAFYSLMQTTGERDRFNVHSLAYYQRAYQAFYRSGACELLMAEHEGQPLAGLMVFWQGKRAWYLYGASGETGRSLMPTYLLQWEAMRLARLHGCEEYDLYGVPDEDEEILEKQFENRSDGLWGVYRFKRGFGGRLRRAAQSFDRVYIPVLYRLLLPRLLS